MLMMCDKSTVSHVSCDVLQWGKERIRLHEESTGRDEDDRYQGLFILLNTMAMDFRDQFIG